MRSEAEVHAAGAAPGEGALAALRHVLPDTAAVGPNGHLLIGGCDLADLAAQFGTPLYLYDEATVRARCRAFRAALAAVVPEGHVAYAAKAGALLGLLRIVQAEGLGLDVVSGGELEAAVRAGFPPERVHFHGNNKTPAELEQALALGVGRIVVDSFAEIERLEALAARAGRRAQVLLRLTPGVDVHTHEYRKTGVLDSKFGFPIATGQAEAAVRQTLAAPHLELLGFHTHLGSQLFELEPYRAALEIVLGFAAEQRARHGLELRELSPGGGWAIAYTRDDPALDVAAAIRAVAQTSLELAERLGLGRPRLFVEPGRAIVGPAGVALYTVGSVKEIPGVRTYVAVDGGMADNIRPALYGARYEALAATRLDEPATETVTIAGKYCESGDLLVQGARLPPLRPGDLLALPAAGAYQLAMASNYNLAPKPAVVLVQDGAARLIRRRQTIADLLAEEE